jgi:hypothetical protein
MTKEERKEYYKKYYQKNKERLKNKDKLYRTLYPERKKAKDYHWWHNVRDKSDKSKINFYAATRRSRLSGKNSIKNNTIKTFYEMSDRLSKCLRIPFHVDHLVPLSKGGPNHETNLLPVPATVNLQKKNNIDFSHPFYSHLSLTKADKVLE